ncbi:unnamed protein product [Psylliodes chrysocephalus]|uniref:Uncharacterized protein n=1 Tax=Psylliodes chrysocephalus TaxID=3402493 RepID=A0A9P0GBW0_9CUCU|nr:unnamed protein product [Psylliodes chrysocephala]
MEDKAVSTEDLCRVDHKRNVALSLARLEAILQTLVENKVESLKNDNRKQSSVHSKPKSILKRLRLTSTSSQSTTKNEKMEENGIIDGVKLEHVVEVENIVRKSALKKESSSSSVGSQQYQYRIPSFEASSIVSDEERNRSMQCDNIESCASINERPPSCCCSQEMEGHILHYDDDYVSLKLNAYGDNIETDTILSEEAIRRARKKRRKRRKKRMKKRMALEQRGFLVEAGVLDESFKHITVEDSTKKAKWTIVGTAFLLLFMCLLLVGITLRMAPIIDEMVRKENEEFVNSLSRHKNISSGVSVHSNNT